MNYVTIVCVAQHSIDVEFRKLAVYLFVINFVSFAIIEVMFTNLLRCGIRNL